MKTTTPATLILTLLTIITTNTCAANKEQDACGALICLTGSGESECSQYLKPYFDIKVFTREALNPKKTLKAREIFLLLCPTGDDDIAIQANKRCGRFISYSACNSTVERPKGF